MDHILLVLLQISQEPRTEKVIGNATSGQNGCERSTLSRKVKKNMQQLHVTIIIQKNYSHNLCSKLISLFSEILGMSLYTAAQRKQNLNKINFLSLTESKKQTLKKKHVKKNY